MVHRQSTEGIGSGRGVGESLLAELILWLPSQAARRSRRAGVGVVPEPPADLRQFRIGRAASGVDHADLVARSGQLPKLEPAAAGAVVVVCAVGLGGWIRRMCCGGCFLQYRCGVARG